MSGLAKIDTLLFDTMGTVVDDTGSIRRQLAEVLQRHGHDGVDVDPIAAEWDRRVRAVMDSVNRAAEPWRGHHALHGEVLVQLHAEGQLLRCRHRRSTS